METRTKNLRSPGGLILTRALMPIRMARWARHFASPEVCKASWRFCGATSLRSASACRSLGAMLRPWPRLLGTQTGGFVRLTLYMFLLGLATSPLCQSDKVSTLCCVCFLYCHLAWHSVRKNASSTLHRSIAAARWRNLWMNTSIATLLTSIVAAP